MVLFMLHPPLEKQRTTTYNIVKVGDNMALPKEKNAYTFADYLAWDGEGRIEIMDGQLIMMAPPSRLHQKISGEIFRQLANFLEGKKCEVYVAPFAVRLFENERDLPESVQTVFEPDISVICDKNKLDEYGCKGAPDMVIEVLSPSTMKHDLLYKMQRYQEAGVKEYWIVSPKEQTVQTYLLNEGKFFPYDVCIKTDIAKVNVLNGCFIELSRVFTE